MMSKKKVEDGTVVQAKPPRDKRESFLRLADLRTNAAINRIRQLVPLANASAYHYTNDDGAAIVSALHAAVDDVKRAFEGQKKARPMFSLRSPPTTNGSASQE